MRTWTRVTKANEEPVTYRDGYNEVAFQATKVPWTYEIIRARGCGAAKAEELINEYCKSGVAQHDYEGGFDEATKNLVTT